mgnify:CR=1 FL=1
MSVNPFIGAYADAMPTYEEKRQKQTDSANIHFQDRMAQISRPIPRMLDTRGNIMNDSVRSLQIPPSYESMYNDTRSRLPEGVMPDVEMISQGAQSASDMYDQQVGSQIAQALASGTSLKKINKTFAKENPEAYGRAIQQGYLQPDTSGKGFGIVNAAVAAGGYGAYKYTSGLLKYVPGKTDLVKGLGAEGYRAVGYNKHGNINTGISAPKGGNYGSLQKLSVAEMTNKKGPYKFSKKKAQAIVAARKTGSKPLQWAGSKKGAMGRNIVKAMIKAGKLGKLGSTAAAVGSGGLLAWPSLFGFAASSVMMWQGEKLLDKLTEGE